MGAVGRTRKEGPETMTSRITTDAQGRKVDLTLPSDYYTAAARRRLAAERQNGGK